MSDTSSGVRPKLPASKNAVHQIVQDYSKSLCQVDTFTLSHETHAFAWARASYSELKTRREYRHREYQPPPSSGSLRYSSKEIYVTPALKGNATLGMIGFEGRRDDGALGQFLRAADSTDLGLARGFAFGKRNRPHRVACGLERLKGLLTFST